jgi:hypothetical protein
MDHFEIQHYEDSGLEVHLFCGQELHVKVRLESAQKAHEYSGREKTEITAK